MNVVRVRRVAAWMGLCSLELFSQYTAGSNSRSEECVHHERVWLSYSWMCRLSNGRHVTSLHLGFKSFGEDSNLSSFPVNQIRK